MIDYLNLALQIKTKRESEGLSAQELANLLGVKMHNIFKWEKGTIPSKPDDYLKLTNWLSGNLESVPKKEENPEPTSMQLLAGLTEGFRAIAETMRSIESKMAQESTQAMINKTVEKIEASLSELSNNQEGGLAIIVEFLKHDVRREAGGNREKFHQLLEEILRKAGPKLSQAMRESIAAHDGI